mmetsp:Transcript_13896/g.25919  ORF Transcript_13896/g.25919 Transcript_13896/m.25919 type:complete len:260 (+) Transcript_13896:57-836(+)
MGNTQSDSVPNTGRPRESRRANPNFLFCGCDCNADSSVDGNERQRRGAEGLIAENLIAEAATFQARGEAEEAKRLYQEALKYDSGHHLANYNLASILFEEEDFEMALKYFEKAMNDRDAEGDPITSCNMSITLMKLGRLEEAEKIGLSAIKGDPQNASLHYNLGNVCLQRKKFAASIVHYQRAFKLQPDHADALFNLAIAYQSEGSIDLAIKNYTAAGQLEPSMREDCDRAIYAVQKAAAQASKKKNNKISKATKKNKK